MQRGHIVKWTALLLVGPIIGVTGVALYERDVSRDTAGLLAGIGWIIAALVTAWCVVRVLRWLPARYSAWAMVAAVPVGVVSGLMHGVVVWLTGEDEPFFFLLAIFGAPLLLVGGFLGRRHRNPTFSLPRTS